MRSSATHFAVTLAGCGAAFAHTLTGGGLEQAPYAAGFLVASGARIGVGATIASAGANGSRMVRGAGALVALAGVVPAAA